jgi:hypothetical protein
MQNKVYIYVNRPKKALKGNLHKAKGYYTNRGHLDQTVLATDRQEDGPHERRPKTIKTMLAQEGPSSLSPCRSDVSRDGQGEAGLC